jgi:general secretion pathway protein J
VRGRRGFTLIELLVAMAIVAIIGVMALGGLRSVISQQEAAEANAERWREIQFAMRVIVQDLTQIHPRIARDESGGAWRPAFLAHPSHQFALEFSRGGWSNPGQFPRGNVLRVAYDIDGDTLLRIYWPVADRTLSTPPVVTELMSGVEELYFSFLSNNLEESVDWPPGAEGPTGLSTAVPRAVQFTLVLEDLGEIWRLVETGS